MTTIAERLDWLFKTHVKPDGEEYTYREIEAGINGFVSGAYIWRLRKGQAENPGYKVLQALCRFFDVPISYFDDEDVTEEYAQDLALARALREAGVAQVALRARGLNEENIDNVLTMIEYIRQAQGLDG